MKQFTFLMALLFSATMSFSQENFPIDFETPDTYTIESWDGGAYEIIDNPFSASENSSSKVLKLTKGTGATWAGSKIMRTTNIDFSTNSLLKMKVYSTRAGIKLSIKLEKYDRWDVQVVKIAETTVTGQWEELEFDFSGSANDLYSNITFVMDDGTSGDGSDDWIIYVDDLNFTQSSSTVITPSIPVTFEDEAVSFEIGDFEGNASTIIDNPVSSGINTSNKVVEVVRNPGSLYSGNAMVINHFLDLANKPYVTMKVYSPKVGATVLFKLEGIANPVQRDMQTTVANQWETLVFDFSGEATDSYNKVVTFFDFNTNNTGTYYYDDIELHSSQTLANNFNELTNEVRVFAYNKTIKLNNLSKVIDGSVSVYDLTGKKVSSALISKNQMSLELSKSGLYIVVISDIDGNMLKNQKVLIN